MKLKSQRPCPPAEALAGFPPLGPSRTGCLGELQAQRLPACPGLAGVCVSTAQRRPGKGRGRRPCSSVSPDPRALARPPFPSLKQADVKHKGRASAQDRHLTLPAYIFQRDQEAGPGPEHGRHSSELNPPVSAQSTRQNSSRHKRGSLALLTGTLPTLGGPGNLADRQTGPTCHVGTRQRCSATGACVLTSVLMNINCMVVADTPTATKGPIPHLRVSNI